MYYVLKLFGFVIFIQYHYQIKCPERWQSNERNDASQWRIDASNSFQFVNAYNNTAS